MKRISLWLPTATMLLVSLISYIDRNTLALLAPTILEESSLSAEQYGWIISSFSVAYMLGNPLWCRWLDRYGLRWGMLAAVLFWTAASASHAAVSGFMGFAVARACLGFGEGATFPGGLRTVVQTLPAHLRSRGAALATRNPPAKRRCGQHPSTARPSVPPRGSTTAARRRTSTTGRSANSDRSSAAVCQCAPR